MGVTDSKARLPARYPECFPWGSNMYPTSAANPAVVAFVPLPDTDMNDNCGSMKTAGLTAQVA